MKTLLLGGSAEARELVSLLTPEFDVISSLAGRLANPALPDGEVRVGGFGGVDGLREWLRVNGIGTVVVATHPFAARMTANAVAACTQLGLPVLVVRRPAWERQPGDNWIDVPGQAAAPSAVEKGDLGGWEHRRCMLTIGRQGVSAFADNTGWFLIRSIDPPDAPLPAHHELLLERGPFTVEHERALLATHRIDILVTKNSGGEQTSAKLVAAREAAIPVVMIARPPVPEDAATVDSVAAVHGWLREQL